MVGLFFHKVYAFRPKKGEETANTPDVIAFATNDPSPEEEELWIVCRNCHNRLTRPSEQTSISGSHQHTFANPSGVVFEICCYRWAQGFAFRGPPSTDFTWFAGHSWQIVICASCQAHLGWHFSGGAAGQFFGFILDQLSKSASTQ